jgi:PII-like signaling protein
MICKGPAKKLTIYIDDSDKFHGRPVYEVLLELCYKKKMAGASVFRGAAGYGADGVFHTAKMLELSSSMPVKIEIVDSPDKIDRILPDIHHIIDKGLIELTETTVITSHSGMMEEKEGEAKRMRLEGKAKMLRIIISEDDTWEGEPLHETIVKRLIMADLAGATVNKALAGYGPHRRYHRKKTLTSTGELPITISVVDTEENVQRALPILDDLVGEGLVIISDVEVIKYTHRHENSKLPE